MIDHEQRLTKKLHRASATSFCATSLLLSVSSWKTWQTVSILTFIFVSLQHLTPHETTGKRWPYLGNAFKYLSAALVIQHGMTHAAGHRGHWWTFSFFLCTMYQILWDSCMDWELLVIVPRSEPELDESRESVSLVPGWVGRWFGWMVRWRCPSFVSSLSPRLFPSRLLGCLILPFRKRISTPLANLFRKFRDSLPSLPRWDQIRLRPRRLFDDDSFYWRALLFNAASRFCWMMGFIPAYRVSILDGSMQVTWATNGLGGFGGLSGMQSWSFVILAVIEIFRRSIWGIIKVELETIKLTSGGENDLAMASTADEYLREGMWNAWRGGEKNRNGLGSKKNLAVEVGHSMQDRNLDAGVEDSNEEEYIPLRQNKSDLGLKSPTSGNAPLNQSYQWLGMTVSRRFMRWAYFVELCIWPLAYVVLSYYVVSSE